MKIIKKGQYIFRNKNFEEKVLPIILSGTIIATITGCSENKNTKEYLNNNGIELTQLYETDKDYDLYMIDKFDKNQILDNDLKSKFDISQINSNICNPNEYKNISEYSNVGYDDVTKLIKNNKQLTDHDKEVLLKGIDNLVSKKININYAVLYSNLLELNVVYFDKTPDEFEGVSVGKFNSINKTMYIPSSKYMSEIEDGDQKWMDFILCHELLGHGSMSLFDEKNNVAVTFEKNICQLSKDFTNISIVGTFLEEGMADIIGTTAVDNNYYAGYPLDSYLVKTYMNVCDLSFNDIYNNDISIIASKMEEKGIKDSYDYLNIADSYIYYFLYSEHQTIIDEETMNSYVTYLYQRYIDYQYTNTDLSCEEIISDVENKINDYKDLSYMEAYEDSVIGLGDEVNGILYIRPSQVVDSCKIYIESLKNIKSR